MFLHLRSEIALLINLSVCISMLVTWSLELLPSVWARVLWFYQRQKLFFFIVLPSPRTSFGGWSSISTPSSTRCWVRRKSCLTRSILSRSASEPSSQSSGQDDDTGCSGKIVFFFHNSLQGLPRLQRCKSPSKLSTQCECTVTPIGRGGKKTQYLMNTLYHRW